MTQFNQCRAQDLRERQLAWEILRKSPTMQMVANMGGPWWRSGRPEKDDEDDPPENGASPAARKYFARRSEGEFRAAQMASSKEAREAHEELARLYAQLAMGDIPAPADQN